MNKTRGANGTASVTFSLPAVVGASHVAVCGEWNGWSSDVHVLDRVGDEFTLTILLEAGRAYRFRYLLDGHRWENDWAADAYVPNEHGGDDSLVDLTALVDEVPPAEEPAAPTATRAAAATTAGTATRATAKKAGTKQTGATKKAGAKQTGATKKAGAAKKAGTKQTGATKKAGAAKEAGTAKKAAAKRAPRKSAG